MATKKKKKVRSKYSEGIEVSEFKGNPVIKLPTGSQYSFNFGLSKARLILQYIDDIKLFIETESSKKDEDDGDDN